MAERDGIERAGVDGGATGGRAGRHGSAGSWEWGVENGPGVRGFGRADIAPPGPPAVGWWHPDGQSIS